MNYLKCSLFNARSLVSKLHELQTHLLTSKPALVCVTETWLNDDIPNQSLLGGINYSVYRCDRSKQHGGGVLILTDNSVISSCVSVDLPEKFANLELVCVDIKGLNITYRIITCYRRPAADTDARSL